MTTTAAKSRNAKPADAAVTVSLPLESEAEAIDLGFGQTKRTGWSLVDDEENPGTKKVVRSFHSFESIAIPSNPAEIRDLANKSRQTVDVPVAGGSYEVGPEIRTAMTGHDFGKDMTDGFYRTHVYEALMKGALRYMGLEHIGVLCLGLPINQWQMPDRRRFLEEKYSGEIILGEDPDTKKQLSVVIDKVVVRPQPLGSYLEAFNHLELINNAIATAQKNGGGLPPLEDTQELHELNVLTIDPGEYTLDWLMVNKGNISPKASGAVSDAGRHRVVTAVTKHLEGKIGTSLAGLTWMSNIDQCLRTGAKFKHSGRLYDLKEFEGVMREAINDPIARMFDGLQSLGDALDLIVVVGGHPDLWLEAIQKRYPAIPSLILPNSMYSNVQGFDLVAHELARRQRAQQMAA